MFDVPIYARSCNTNECKWFNGSLNMVKKGKEGSQHMKQTRVEHNVSKKWANSAWQFGSDAQKELGRISTPKGQFA